MSWSRPSGCGLMRIASHANADLSQGIDAVQAVAMADSSDDDDLPLATRVRAVSRKISGGKQVGMYALACPCPRYITCPSKELLFINNG